MQERQVTLADTTFRLDDPFWVLATQNPVEQEGVYTLPEAQLDRFSMMLRVGYPSPGDESRMLQVRPTRRSSERRLDARPTSCEIRELIVDVVHIDDRIREYIVRLGRATRDPAASAGRRCARCCSSASRRARTSTCSRWPGSPRSCTAGPDVLPGDVKEILLRRDAAPHRPQRARRGRERARRRDPRRDPATRCRSRMMAGLHCAGRQARSGVMRS